MMRLAGCVIRDDRGRILLLHRNKPDLSWWEIPGGQVEEGEAPEAAAIREVREETGLEVRIGGLLGEAELESTNHEPAQFYWFSAEIVSGEPRALEPESHDEISYMDITDLGRDQVSTSTNWVRDNLKDASHG